MAKKTITTVAILDKKFTRIRHCDTRMSVAKDEAALTEARLDFIGAVNDYCATVLQEMKNGSIYTDPMGVIQGKCFKRSHFGHSVVQAFLESVQQEEGLDILTARHIEDGEQGDFVRRFKDGTVIMYKAASNKLTVVKGKAKRVFDTLKLKAVELWNAVQEFFAQGVQKTKEHAVKCNSWFSSVLDGFYPERVVDLSADK